MSVIATAVRHLMAAGVTGEELLVAIAELEAEVRNEPKPRSAGAIRQERYRRNKASQTVTSDACDESRPLSRPPNEIKSNPTTHTPGIKTPRTRKAEIPLPDDWQPKPFGPNTECRKIVAGWPPGELERQAEHFRASHTAKGNRFADWQQAWATWVLNHRNFNRGSIIQPSFKPTGSTADTAQRVRERMGLAG